MSQVIIHSPVVMTGETKDPGRVAPHSDSVPPLPRTQEVEILDNPDAHYTVGIRQHFPDGSHSTSYFPAGQAETILEGISDALAGDD